MSESVQVYPELLPCPFCGGPVELERPAALPRGSNEWFGVVCRNTINRGGTCAIEQRPSRTKEAAIDRWNMRGGVLAASDACGVKPCRT